MAGDAKGGLFLWQCQSSSKPQQMQVALRGRVTQLCAVTPFAPPTLPDSDDGASAALSSPLVLASCSDGSVTVLDVDAGAALHCFSAHRGTVHAVGWVPLHPSVAPHAGLVVTCSGEEGTVKVRPSAPTSFRFPTPASATAFLHAHSRFGSRLLRASWSKLLLIDLQVWQVLGVQPPGGAAAPALRPLAVGLLATLPAGGGAGGPAGAGGRHAHGRHQQQRMQPQWLTASFLTPAFLEQRQLGGALAQAGEPGLAHVWVATGLPTGELQLQRVHAGAPRVLLLWGCGGGGSKAPATPSVWLFLLA